MFKIIIIILIFGFAQSLSAGKDTAAVCKANNKPNPTNSVVYHNFVLDLDKWVYSGNAKWKISERTTLDMDVYCIDENYFNEWANDTLIKTCLALNHKNKSIKDSLVYKNGYWELKAETYEDNGAETKMTHMHGIRLETKYDSLGRIESSIGIVDSIDASLKDTLTMRYAQIMSFGSGRTIISYHYIWGEKGRLMQATFKGKTANITYGTPCDSVRIDLNDGTYNKNFGMIPEEEDPEYKEFKRDPCRSVSLLRLGYLYTCGINSPELLERQKQRCEDYKATRKKKGSKK
jgi:hypothetical protein